MPCPIPQVILCVIERNVLCRDLLLIQPLLNPEMSGAWLRTEAGVYPSTADRCLKTPMKDASGPWGLGPLCAIACMIHEPSIATLALREREYGLCRANLEKIDSYHRYSQIASE